MNKYTIKDILSSKTFVFIFSIVLFLSSCYIDKVPFSFILDYISIGLSLLVISLYIIRFKFSKSTIALLLFIVLILFSTLLNDAASVNIFIKSFMKIVSLALFIDWVIEYNSKNIIRGLYYSLYIVILINFLTIVIYPNGLYSGSYINNWFLGYDNTHIFWYIPALVLSLINLKFKGKKIDILTIVLFVIISYSVYYCFSANSVVAYTLFLAYLFLNKYINKFVNSKVCFIAFLLLFIFIVILRVQNIFSWLIVDILHKDLSFTGRTIVWDNTIKLIKEKFVFGYGMEEGIIVSQKLGNAHYVHAHNTLLDVLYKGGIIALVPFMSYIYLSILKLYKKRENEIAKMVSFAVFSLLLMMLFEARETAIGFYIIFSISYNIDYILERIEYKKEGF